MWVYSYGFGLLTSNLIFRVLCAERSIDYPDSSFHRDEVRSRKNIFQHTLVRWMF